MDSQIDEETVHVLRKQIDANIVAVKSWVDTRPSKGGAELTLAYRKLQEAKMWLGKVLEEIGSELPKEFQDKAE
jgi:hypothetical protein